MAAGALVLLGFLFPWSGVYNVAASRGHWAVVEWLLAFVMRNSVKTHATGIEPPPLDRPDLVTLGAGHFHGGCACCHGAPGMPAGPVARQHAAAAARSRDADAAVERPRAVLDRQARHQIHRHAGLGRAAARRRGLGGGRVPAAASRARCRRLSRARARRPANSPRRAGARSRPTETDVGGRLRALSRRRAQRRRARWCRSCTDSRPNCWPPRCTPMRAGAATAASCSRSRAISSRRSASAWRATTPGCRPRRASNMQPAAAAAIERGRAARRAGRRGRRDSGLRRLSRRRGAADLSASRRPERAYMANRLRLWKGGLARRHRRRGDHGADRARAERAADRRRRRPISPRSAARPRRPPDESAAAPLARAARGARPRRLRRRHPVGAGAARRRGRRRSRRWPGCCSGSAPSCSPIVVAAAWLAIRGSPRMRAALARERSILAVGHRVSGGRADAAARLRRLADAGAACASATTDAVRIEVIGEQWWWRVAYARRDGAPIASANEIRIPVGRAGRLHAASPPT